MEAVALQQRERWTFARKAIVVLAVLWVDFNGVHAASGALFGLVAAVQIFLDRR